VQKTNRDAIVIIISLIVFIVLSYFFIYPKISDLREKNYNLALKKDELKKTQEHLTSLKELAPKFDRKKDDLNALEEALPYGDGTEDLVSFLESAAKDKGLAILSITPQTLDEDSTESVETTPSGFKIAKIKSEVSLTGSYPALKGYLELLEGARKIINVSGLSISSAAGTLNPGNLVITMSLSSYYLNNL